jgi:predicted dienelactone hydrolase
MLQRLEAGSAAVSTEIMPFQHRQAAPLNKLAGDKMFALLSPARHAYDRNAKRKIWIPQRQTFGPQNFSQQAV